MSLLFDTHTFLWWATEPTRLSDAAHRALSSDANATFLSVVVLWEIQIKVQIGKLSLTMPLSDLVNEQCAANGFVVLPVEPRHVYALDALPLHHRDPFDRLLLAQAEADGLTLVSRDGAFSPYGVSTLW
ncbi:MAG: type II toxin-antitoxin system VapC family toxin [Bacteroidota bacterium]